MTVRELRKWLKERADQDAEVFVGQGDGEVEPLNDLTWISPSWPVGDGTELGRSVVILGGDPR